MITTGCIPKINPDDFDEVWWIVRSPDTIPVKEKLVSELAPSPELFRDYRQAFHAGRFGTEYFQNVYVPWFLKDLEKNLEAQERLEYLCQESRTKRIALCCYCEDESLCHRSIIAGILLGMGAVIETKEEYRKYFEMPESKAQYYCQKHKVSWCDKKEGPIMETKERNRA